MKKKNQKRNLISFLLKVLVFLSVLLIVYSLLLSKFNSAQEKLISTKIQLLKQQSNLVQNRISFIELTRLDPNGANFDIEKSDLIARLQMTNKQGLEDPSFPNEAKELYQRQNKLLEEVFTTSSYEEGVAILKSPKALELLTDQTNLILKLEFQIQELEKELELSRSQSGLKELLQVQGQPLQQ